MRMKFMADNNYLNEDQKEEWDHFISDKNLESNKFIKDKKEFEKKLLQF